MNLGKFNYNIIFIVILFYLPFHTFADSKIEYDLIYKLKYQSYENDNCFLVSVDFKGDEGGQATLRIPSYAGNASFNSKGNVTCNRINDHVYQFLFDPKHGLHAEYQSCVKNSQLNIDYPIYEPNFFLFQTGMMLITPESDNNNLKKIKVQLEAPEKFNIISSYNIGSTDFTIEKSISDFRNIIIGGTAEKIKTVHVNNYPVYVISTGKWNFFENKPPEYYIEKIISAQRKFWGDYDFPHYVVVLLQSKHLENEKYIIGTHKPNLIIMKIPDGDKSKLPKVLRPLSHELFHAWLGNKIKVALPQGDTQWFFEGVNDYYSLEILRENNLISEQEHINFYNEVLKTYMLSPCMAANNDEVKKNFTPRGPYTLTAEMRGHILFKELSYYLKKQDGSRNKIDLAIKEVLQKFNSNQVGNLELHAIFSKNVGKKVWDKIQYKIENGSSIELCPDVFGKDYTLTTNSVDVPSFGFDINNFIKTKKIQSLNPNSNAYLSGLRESHNVIDYLFNFSNPNIPSQILIGDKNGTEIIHFSPNHIKKSIPQYTHSNILLKKT